MFFHGALALERRKPLVRHPKAKGNAYEKYICDRLRRFWPNIRRNLASGGRGGSDACEVPDYAIEMTKRETLNVWKKLAQAEAAASPTQTPLLIFARNRSRDYACMPLDDLEGLWEQLGLVVERGDSNPAAGRRSGLPPLPAGVAPLSDEEEG